ncbi:hypothetical protein MKX01_023171 [Papaver californicum]|nr:hypothetical protein MKX01_023171 [Papaver californicum]
MGITGLLPRLKSIMIPIQYKRLMWMFSSCRYIFLTPQGSIILQQRALHIAYCMHRVNLLRHYGVKHILENLKRAMEHESMGKSATTYECYQKAVDISPAIANELIQVLKQENIDFVIALYEDDAQMAFLAISKQVDAVINEDSDLIPFGCPRVNYLINEKLGQGVQFQSSLLQKSKKLNLSGFTQQMVLEMCILSGYDYLQSLPGMGLMKALKLSNPYHVSPLKVLGMFGHSKRCPFIGWITYTWYTGQFRLKRANRL